MRGLAIYASITPCRKAQLLCIERAAGKVASRASPVVVPPSLPLSRQCFKTLVATLVVSGLRLEPASLPRL